MSRNWERIFTFIYAGAILLFLYGFGAVVFAEFASLGLGTSSNEFETRVNVFLWMGLPSGIVGLLGVIGFMLVERFSRDKGRSAEGMRSICAFKTAAVVCIGVSLFLFILFCGLMRIGVKEKGEVIYSYAVYAATQQAIFMPVIFALIVLFVFNLCETLSDWRYYRRTFPTYYYPDYSHAAGNYPTERNNSVPPAGNAPASSGGEHNGEN